MINRGPQCTDIGRFVRSSATKQRSTLEDATLEQRRHTCAKISFEAQSQLLERTDTGLEVLSILGIVAAGARSRASATAHSIEQVAGGRQVQWFYAMHTPTTPLSQSPRPVHLRPLLVIWTSPCLRPPSPPRLRAFLLLCLVPAR